MGWFDRWFTTKAVTVGEQKSLSQATVLVQRIPEEMQRAIGREYAEPSKAPKTDDRRIAYIEQHPVAYWCVNKLAMSAASVPWYIAGPDGQPDQGHPLNQLLEQPNAKHSRSEMMQLVFGGLAATGNAYLVKVPAAVARYETGGLPPIGALYPLRPSRVRVQSLANDTTTVDYYDYTFTSNSQKYRPEEICHIKHAWVGEDIVGKAVLDSIFEPAATFLGFVRLARKILENSGGIPGFLVFKNDKGLSDKQRNQIQEHIDRFRLDGDKFGELGLLDVQGDVTFLGVAGDTSNLEPQASKMDAARQICLGFGIPPVLYTASESGPTYSNFQEANRSFWTETVIPYYINPMQTALTQAFGMPVVPDLTEVPALSKMNSENVANTLRTTGILTVNEQRAQLGYPAHPMGDRIVTNPGAIALDTQLALADANAVTNVDPRLLQGILEADAQSRAVLGKMLQMMSDGASDDTVRMMVMDLVKHAKGNGKVRH